MTARRYEITKRDRVVVLRRIAEQGWTKLCTIDGPSHKLGKTGLVVRVISAGDQVRVMIRPIEKRDVPKKVTRRERKTNTTSQNL